MSKQTDVETLAAHFVGVFPKLDGTDRQIALGVYRRLAEGLPVAAAELAKSVGLPENQVAARLRGWPGVYYDDSRRVIGFWGLTIVPMPHRLRTSGVALYAWCAWDTLFLPELIGRPFEVESKCRGSGIPVRFKATPIGVQQAEPAELALSLLVPDADRVNVDVITSFCHYVHFFSSPQVAQPWLAEHRDSFLLSLAEGFALGREVNRARYGSSVGSGVGR